MLINYESANVGGEGSWNGNLWRVLKEEIFPHHWTNNVVQMSEQEHFYKLGIDNKILWSVIEKAMWCTSNFLDHFREANEQ